MDVDWTTILISLVGSGGVVGTSVVAYWQYRESKASREAEAAREKNDRTSETIAQLRAQIDQIQSELMQTKAEQAAESARWDLIRDYFGEGVTLRQILEGANATVATKKELRRWIRESPRICWLQERHGALRYSMFAVSDPYAEQYIPGPPELYEGKLNTEFFDQESAAKMYQADELAYTSQKPVVVMERLDDTDSPSWFVGVKRSFRFSTGEDMVEGMGDHFTTTENADRHFRWIMKTVAGPAIRDGEFIADH